MHSRRRPFRLWPWMALASVVVGLGCELEEVTLAEPEDIMVVEAYIMVGDGRDQVSAFLHWTLGTRPARDLLDRDVLIIREDGMTIPLIPDDPEECLLPELVEVTEGVCFSAGPNAEGLFWPGSRVELEIQAEGVGTVRGATVIPDDFHLTRPSSDRCALPPDTTLNLVWTRSPGVWAYSAETEIRGLKAALGVDGIEVEADSVALLGLAVSDADTTIAFPKEFGVFDRFDLEQELALALQKGLPRGVTADVVIAGLDQNYANWVRGGNFNPSGPVRVSSLRGPGLGVFGSVFRRTLVVKGGDPIYTPGQILPGCLLGQGP